MELGSKEWFEKLNKMVNFPNVFSFYVTPEGGINSSVVDSKAQNLNNISYGKLKPPILIGEKDTALVSVIRCRTDQEYYQECLRLKKKWGSKEQEG